MVAWCPRSSIPSPGGPGMDGEVSENRGGKVVEPGRAPILFWWTFWPRIWPSCTSCLMSKEGLNRKC
jgi:hypothetical protein